jgi:hypothetical protein
MKKLSLNRETVRTLNSSELQEVNGGKLVVIIINTGGDTEGGTYSDCPSMCINMPCNSGNYSDCANCTSANSCDTSSC